MLEDFRGIPWEARFLIYLSFLPGISLGFIYTDLSYFLPNLALSYLPHDSAFFWMGIVVGTMAATLVVSSVPLGIVADRYGRRRLLVLGNLLAGVSLMGFALTTSIPLLLAAAVLEGVGEAAFAVSFGALVADRAGDAKRTSAFALVAFLGWTSGAIGALSISSVAAIQVLGFDERQAHVALYVVVALLGLSVTPLMFKVHEGKVAPAEPRKGFFPKKSKDVLVRFSFYSVTLALGAGLFVPLMTAWFHAAYGVTDVVSGPVLAGSAVLTSAAILLAPRFARRIGMVKAIVASQALATAFMLLVPSSPTFAIAGAVYSIRVFLMNLSNPLGQSLLMGLVSPDERGAASGVAASLWRLPNALSSFVGAALIGAGLVALPFYIATVLYVVAISLFWFMFKNAKLPEESMRSAQVLAQSSSLEGPEEPR
ncbi:MAG: MFS transporter [archaeon]|nr:MAG: MFS transporter [archaeon]